MATTNYAYHNDESLGDIANKFNTSVLNLVKLNKWLQDPNDGHTYMIPSKAPEYIAPHTDAEGNVDYYDLNPDPESPDIIRYRSLVVIVPLIGNGRTSIEDYWETVNKVTGISYNLLVNNIISDTTMTDINLGQNSDYDPDNPDDTNKQYSILYNRDTFYGASTTYGELNASTNAYMDAYVNDNNSSQIGKPIDERFTGVDYAAGVIGNFLQSQINAGSQNLNIYKNSGLYRGLGSNYFNNYARLLKDRFDINKFSYKDKDNYSDRRERSIYRDISNTYSYGNTRYGSLGNPNIVKGDCIVTINNMTLYMPCYPEEVSDTTTVNYTSQNVLGRSEPYQAYNNSGPRTITFSFKMHREMTGNVAEIENIVRYVESAVYPNYNEDNSSVAAVKASVKIGNTIYIEGIMSNEVTNWSGPIGPDKKYNVVNISFTITEVTGNPKTSKYVSEKGGFRTE